MRSHPDQLLLQLLTIFVSAKVAGEVFERVKLPSVLGEILAGTALGPFALGWIHPSDTINSVAEIGAIFVLFNAGLEISPQDLIQVGRKAVLVAVAGVVVPFVLGFGYMKWLGDATSEAIFVGAAMVATSVGITARVLGDLVGIELRRAGCKWRVTNPALSIASWVHFHHGYVFGGPPIMPDGRISQVRFEVLASRPGAFPFAARFKRWFAYAPTTNGLLSA